MDVRPLLEVRQQTPRQLRIGGAIMIVLGAVVLIGGLLFAMLLLGMVPPESWLPDGTRIEGTPGEGLSAAGRIELFAIAATFLSYGIAAVSLGFWQIVTARQPRILLKFMMAVVVMIFIAGGLASVLSGCQVGRICQ